MNESFQTSEILQDRTFELPSCKLALIITARKEKNDPEGATTQRARLSPFPFQKVRLSPPRFQCHIQGCQPELWEQGHFLGLWRSWLLPQWAKRIEHQDKENYSQAFKSNGICIARFWTCFKLVTFYSSNFSILQ